MEIEDEVDLYDPVMPGINEMSGNALLSQFYLIKEPLLKNSESFDDIQENTETESTGKDSSPGSPLKEKILEEEYETSGSRSSRDSSKKISNSASESSPKRQPCSFFISTSPPLPSLSKPILSSDISSSTRYSWSQISLQYLYSNVSKY